VCVCVCVFSLCYYFSLSHCGLTTRIKVLTNSLIVNSASD